LVQEEDTNLAILHGLADPRNVGSIIRTAACLGWKVVLSTGAPICDVFGQEAIRSAKGAHIADNDLLFTGSLSDLPAERYTIVASAVPNSQKIPGTTTAMISQMCADKPIALILGNESHGLDLKSIKQSPHFSISIPMFRGNSMNVASACAILMYQLGSHRLDVNKLEDRRPD
jgi:tRNA G18 (ribose-2'-O)-methylase SpoU